MDVLMVKLVVPVFRNVRLAVSIGHHGKEFLRELEPKDVRPNSVLRNVWNQFVVRSESSNHLLHNAKDP